MKSSLIIKIVIAVISITAVAIGGYLYINNNTEESKEDITAATTATTNTLIEDGTENSLEIIEEVEPEIVIEETEEITEPIVETTEEEVITPEEDPSALFAAARDTQRTSDINIIMNAVIMYFMDENGSVDVTSCVTNNTGQEIGTGAGNYNLDSLIVPTYLTSIPQDPTIGSATATGYYICEQAVAGRYQISAISESTGELITVTK